MAEALSLASSALLAGEIPVGAVLVRSGVVIGRGTNRQLRDNDPAAHAEIIALRDAGSREKNYRLDGSDMYVTVKPCRMCREAIKRARISRVYYASPMAKDASHITCYTELKEHASESTRMMKDFFSGKRR